MEFRKNDLVTLEIEDCGIDGEGIGKADGFTVFVKDAVIGDTVTAKIIKAKKVVKDLTQAFIEKEQSYLKAKEALEKAKELLALLVD